MGGKRYINILTCISCKYYCEFPKDMWKYYRYTHAKKVLRNILKAPNIHVRGYPCWGASTITVV